MCGIFGVIGTNQAASEIFLALQNLQHRGEDGAGIVIADETGLHKHYGLGLLDIAFSQRVQHLLNRGTNDALRGAVTLTANLVLSQSLLSTLRIGHGSD